MSDDVLARIDDTLTHVAAQCCQCEATLKPDGPSLLFCNELCQEAFYGRSIVPEVEQLQTGVRAFFEAVLGRWRSLLVTWAIAYAIVLILQFGVFR